MTSNTMTWSTFLKLNVSRLYIHYKRPKNISTKTRVEKRNIIYYYSCAAVWMVPMLPQLYNALDRCAAPLMSISHPRNSWLGTPPAAVLSTSSGVTFGHGILLELFLCCCMYGPNCSPVVSYA